MATAATTAGHVKQSECCQVANKSLKFSVRINIDAGSAVDGMNTIAGITHPSHPGFHICNTQICEYKANEFFTESNAQLDRYFRH